MPKGESLIGLRSLSRVRRTASSLICGDRDTGFGAARASGAIRRRSILFALLFCGATSAAAQDAGVEPSALVCNEFKIQSARTLAQSPDSLQINNLLFEAARKGCVDALESLLKAGASPKARDRMGNNALAIASRMGRFAFVKALLDADDKVDSDQLDRPNVLGSTPRIKAARANRTDVAKLLIGAGAKVDAANNQGETALSAAAFNANTALAEVLLAHKAPPDTTDASGKGVIVYAAARGAARLVEMLLDAGVDSNRRYSADLTALMWAAGHADNAPKDGALRTVKLLMERGATIDLADDRGRTALMIAASLNHGEIAQTLLAAGADRSKRDKAGKSAADLADDPEVKAIIATP
jgi:ankyrin repeat protein